MSSPVGYIFQQGLVICKDPYGRWIVQVYLGGKKENVILEDTFINKGLTLKKGDYTSNLVVIDNSNKNLKVALDNFMAKLKDYYYIGNTCRISVNKWEPWYNRWTTECAAGFKTNFSITNSGLQLSNGDPIYQLRGNNYFLPLRGMRNSSHLKPSELFYPATPYKGSASIAAYKTDGTNGFPLLYSGSGKSTDGLDDKNVLIFLHSFLDPHKWHYGVWKHILGLEPTANKNEDGVLWNNVLGNGKGNSYSSYFSRCQSKDGNCNDTDCLSKNLFSNVHAQIKHLCAAYLKEVVTCFEDGTTNITVIVRREENKWVQVVVEASLIKKGVEEILILKGECYNWDDNGIPVMHLIPITLYRKYSASKAKLTSRKKIGELIDNIHSKVIPIFNGKLTEVQRQKNNE